MTFPPLRSPQTHHSTVSDPRNRLALTPQASSTQNKIASNCLFAPKRLFDGTGRTINESNELVRSAQELQSKQDLVQALNNYTTAIAEMDKLKANDLRHAQAYLGAAAIFECLGELQKALDYYLIGSRMLNRLYQNQLLDRSQKNPILLAGSYVRIALLYERRDDEQSFHLATENFKKALVIYRLDAEMNHIKNVSNKLSKIYLKHGQTKTAKIYASEAGDLNLFQKDQVFLQDYLELHTKTEREVSLLSSRSSVDTAPSPLKEATLPSIHVGCSPTRVILFNQNVSTSPEQQKDLSSSRMQTDRQNKQAGPSPLSKQDTASSPIQFLPEINGTAKAKLDANLSPIRFNQNVSTSPEQQKDLSSSPIRSFSEINGTAQPKLDANPSPIRFNQNVGPSPEQQKDLSSSRKQIDRRNKQVGSLRKSIQNTSSSPIGFLPEINGTAKAKLDANPSPIRIERNEFSSVIAKLEGYKPRHQESEKIVAANTLLAFLKKFAKDECSLDILEIYINSEFDIKDNPAFAGRKTHRLKDIFEETRKQLVLLKRTN